jgi:hypothetical protein
MPGVLTARWPAQASTSSPPHATALAGRFEAVRPSAGQVTRQAETEGGDTHVPGATAFGDEPSFLTPVHVRLDRGAGDEAGRRQVHAAEVTAAAAAAPVEGVGGRFLEACRDHRVWALFVIYGACFGIELTINNIAALYCYDYFGLGLAAAGVVAGLFGLMNIFARTLGGVVGD